VAEESSSSSSSSSEDGSDDGSDDDDKDEAGASWETLPLDQSTESLGVPAQGASGGKRGPAPAGPKPKAGTSVQAAAAALQGLSLGAGAGSKAAPAPAHAAPADGKKKEIFLPHIAISRESLGASGGLRGVRPRPARPVNTALSKTLLDEFTRKQAVPAYQAMLRQRSQLPAWEHKDLLLDAIRNHQVVVVSGETGCGKSTQVPQFVLDDFLQQGRGSECNILVTQPRRISAIGVADRVASERADRLGQSVGYQIHLENKMSKATRILFCTTGILLRKLEGSLSAGADRADTGIDSISHIIVDEVHERSLESDFLLMVLRELLRTRKDLKVILMSATLNANLFADYFGNGVPAVHIPGRTFPVKVG
jgi:HrpA-like RNA helicase